MRSIERRFALQKQQRPDLGDFTNLMKTVLRQRYSRQTISYWFPKLVNKSEYDKSDKKSLIDNLVHVTNMPEDHTKKGKNCPDTKDITKGE